jgi:hypothetical protein
MSTISVKSHKEEDVVLDNLSVPNGIIPADGSLVELTQWNSIAEIKEDPQLQSLISDGTLDMYIDGNPVLEGDVEHVFDPAPTSFFGTEVNHFEDDRKHSTTGTSFSGIIKNDFKVPEGTYLFSWSAEAAGTPYWYCPRVRLVIDEEVVSEVYGTGLRSDPEPLGAVFSKFLKAGTHTFYLEFAAKYYGYTVWVRRARVMFWRLA